MPVEVLHGRGELGEMGSDHLIGHVVNCGQSWCLHDSRVSCCYVYPLQGCKLVQISVTPSEMGDVLIAVFKHSNSTSLCIVNYMDDVNTL
jgi:hypothetical protein